MKKIIAYNAKGDKAFRSTTIKDIIKWVLFFLYTPICHILLNIVKRRRSILPKQYKVSIAAIFKNEAENLSEWIYYHQLIGVDHFYLYNNFSEDNYSDILQPFIDDGVVTLIDWPHMFGQAKAYTHVLNNYTKTSNWIAFIDIDEYICMKTKTNIYELLSNYNDCPCLLLNWKMFGTSGLQRRDETKLIIEQFTASWPNYTTVGKSIINTAYKFKECNHVHLFNSDFAGFLIPPVDEFKQFVIYWKFMPNIFRKDSTVWINHYWSKSYEEFVYKSNVRGPADCEASAKTSRDLLTQRFNYHESQNTVQDYTIQRFMGSLKTNIK